MEPQGEHDKLKRMEYNETVDILRPKEEDASAQETTEETLEPVVTDDTQRQTNEVEHLEYLNQCWDTLVQYVHDHVVSGIESLPITIEQLAEIKPESLIAKRYQHAQEICAQYTKVENDIKELQEKILGMEILMAALDEYVTSKKQNISLDIPTAIQMDPRFVLKHEQAKRIAQEFEKKQRTLSASKQKMQEMEIKIKSFKQNENKQLQSSINHYKMKTDTQTQEIAMLKREMETLLTSNEELRAANQNLKTSYSTLQQRCNDANALSKIASDRPTQENTDMPDLSDETCPSKLTEKMSDLYANQWTSAFDEMKTSGFEDEKSIGILLKIVMETNQVCKTMTFSHYKKLKEACTCFEYSSSADEENTEQGKIFLTGNINIEMQQGIKIIWRESSKKVLNKVIPIIMEKVAEKFEIALLKMTQIPLYMKECAELCWMMNIQEKPMHLAISVPEKTGHTYFDTEKFTSYTKSGQHVAFFVWPALYLFEGGSLLKKGVAQGLIVGKGRSSQKHSSLPRS